MPDKIYNKPFLWLTCLCAAVFFSRLPFLFAGFGAEEDSWLLAITARKIAESGSYTMSRAPAHPLQEIIYSCMYDNGLLAFATNLLSAIASTVAVVFFALSLKHIGFRHYLFASFAFAFTPVVFVSSTYTIDYMLAMAFVMMSFYFLLTGVSTPDQRSKQLRILFAGFFLGIATGFRITSIAMLIPFSILLFPFFNAGLRYILILCITTSIIGALAYVPVIKTYGFSFFTYADQFPYPNFPKLIYKATIGVFGTIGISAILFLKLKILFGKSSLKKKLLSSGIPPKLFPACIAVIVLYTISYLRLPQKSAYLIPAVPFIIMLSGYFLSSRSFKLFCVLMVLSSFFFSMNLTDSLRGSAHSQLSYKFTISGQEIFLDPLTGPVFSDYTKRLNKISFTEEVFRKTRTEKRKIVLICGWWYNELLVRNWGSEKNQNVVLVFYSNKMEMEKYISEGYQIYYLPEQNLYNDLYSKMNFTDSIAKLYF